MYEETRTGRPHDTSVQKATSDNENVIALPVSTGTDQYQNAASNIPQTAAASSNTSDVFVYLY